MKKSLFIKTISFLLVSSLFRPISLLFSLIFLILILFAITNSYSQQYYNKPSKTIPAGHLWVFNEKEISQILVQYLKSQGTNVPDGKINIEGLESHYDWVNNERIELIVIEKDGRNR